MAVTTRGERRDHAVSEAAAVLGLAAASAQTIGVVLSQRLTDRLTARQLIGRLPAGAAARRARGLATDGSDSALHAVETMLLIGTSVATWDLYAHGEAWATATAQSLSPLPAALAVALLCPASTRGRRLWRS